MLLKNFIVKKNSKKSIVKKFQCKKNSKKKSIVKKFHCKKYQIFVIKKIIVKNMYFCC